MHAHASLKIGMCRHVFEGFETRHASEESTGKILTCM
jgi:hypothetical protein